MPKPLLIGVSVWAVSDRTPDFLCVRERQVFSTGSTPYLGYLPLYYLPIFRGVIVYRVYRIYGFALALQMVANG
jgi:hypothetical protein